MQPTEKELARFGAMVLSILRAWRDEEKTGIACALISDRIHDAAEDLGLVRYPCDTMQASEARSIGLVPVWHGIRKYHELPVALRELIDEHTKPLHREIEKRDLVVRASKAIVTMYGVHWSDYGAVSSRIGVELAASEVWGDMLCAIEALDEKDT